MAAAAVGALAVVAFAPRSAHAACAPTGDFADVRLPTTCLSAQESQAVQMRMFRAELAVAALSCQQQSQYNTVVTRHQDELVREGRALRGIFQRVYRAGAERELNRFITHLANRASLKRLTQPTYCQTMARVFREAQAQPRQGLLAYVQGGTPTATSMMASVTPPPGAQALAAMDTAAGKSGKPVLDD
ncbi:hypothetical protein RJ527_10735 [Thalassospiraceae bacterium LMO-SO8]|nr:hypothetical protein [Alphaproteobacteria bacterium LMO-S08]WND74521.1 hypothetical protein RJ527_10735 [Thalassospiraceae bacterium LMO-SO8]